MAIHSSTLTWRIPWTEEPGHPQSMGSQRVVDDWANNTHTHNLAFLLLYFLLFNHIFIFAFFSSFPKSHSVLEQGIVTFLFYHVNFLSHCISEKFKPEVNPAFVHLFYPKQPLNSKCLSFLSIILCKQSSTRNVGSTLPEGNMGWKMLKRNLKYLWRLFKYILNNCLISVLSLHIL